jgi:alpha-1,3-rhamnosyl/mannosyltransferase
MGAMRVVMNTVASLGRRTGIGHYVSELLRCSRAQMTDGVVDSFPGERIARVCAWAYRQRRHATDEKAVQAGWRRWAWQQARSLGQGLLARRFRQVVRQRQYHLYHEPNYIPLPCDLPTIATVHDLSIVLHPEWHPGDRVAHYGKYFAARLNRCAHVITDSRCVRDEVVRHLGVDPERVSAVPLGTKPNLRPAPAEEVERVRSRLGLPRSYLLYVGTIEPRKNVRRLLEAFCDLPNRLRERCPLVLVGGWGWQTADVAAYFHDVARHKHVQHVGYVEEADLPALYSGARALVYPSLYEGFGLPPLEMMACGGAVLTSTARAIAEVVGDRVPLIAPEDTEGWRDAMARVIDDDDWQAELRDGAEKAARAFSWERCAAETLRIYRRVLGLMR